MAPHLQIYIAEDSLDDCTIIEHCLAREKLSSIRFFHDGEELKEYCAAHEKIPFLLLLDLKMPRAESFEVLGWLKTGRKFKCNPVIILSSSQEPVDVRRAYYLGANAYLEKPRDLRGYREMILAIRKFWVEQNKCAASG